ncbi:MAG: hypothetical protein R6X15_01170 [Pseudomonadota bacterium]
MMLSIRSLRWLLLLLGPALTFNANAERLYCEGAKELRCIGADQRVVKSNAVCFDPKRCGQEGFVCKATLDDLAGEHNTLRRQYSELADTHNELIETYENSVDAHEHNVRCINRATTLEQAKSCI